MSVALTESLVIQYIKTMLGSPVVKVELTDDQIKQFIAQALAVYSTFKPVEKFGSIDVLPQVQKYDVTAAQIGKGILETFRPDLLRNAISLEQFDVFKYHTHLPNLDPGDFYAERIWWSEVRRSAGADDDWDLVIDPETGDGVLYLSPSPSQAYKLTYVYLVDPTLKQVPKSDDSWIKDYSLALSMEALGRIRRKFGSVQGSESSITMDGAELVAEAEAKKKDLDDYLYRRGHVNPPIRG